ncbi:hypothetical protein F5B22DRAFT_611971 [Xylaria bambusicola]|uniref:uncharacterized protein n=1 Tax=Xylaria bambusicola TaxID=326684 RepID=UPI00200759FD|nr:uncharacterized protein F5B22DRAFT_611971 [Xylaria bambusicola]KAI0513287.1 hypothetical protein F5B22DRAFT_611971 [Xylaria bambusicola]
MATSRFETEVYTAEGYVESAGTILFRLSTCEICVLHLLSRDEYILAKGRRNVGESRAATALRETTEETGVPCYLLPINLHSRACPPGGEVDLPDKVRLFDNACEPIGMHLRRLGENNIKIIWWYVAAVSEGEPVGQHEDRYQLEFYKYEEALEKLTYGNDRALVRKAVELVESTIRTT